MQQSSVQRLPTLFSAVISLATLAGVVLLGLVLAYWTWAWFSPRTEARLETAAEPAIQVAAANTLFGTAQQDQKAASPTGLAIKLQGVMAAPGGNHRDSYAVLQLEGKQNLAVHVGEDIAPGIRLAEVHPDHVILERNGVRESLAWPESTAAPAAQPRNKRAAPPAGISLKKD